MADDSIRLSPKHGVNPSVTLCFFCGQEVGVVLFGLMEGDQQAPRRCVTDMEPCDECKGWMEKGIILIGIDPELSDPKLGPGGFWRSGHYVTVKEEAFRRGFTGEAAVFGLEHRWCFVDKAILEQLPCSDG